MKVLLHIPHINCNCSDRLFAFADDERRAGRPMDVGSVVECDCKRLYQLRDDQRDGLHWAALPPGETLYDLNPATVPEPFRWIDTQGVSRGL